MKKENIEFYRKVITFMYIPASEEIRHELNSFYLAYFL